MGYASLAEVAVDSVSPGTITVQSVTGGSCVRDLAAARTGDCIILEPNSNLASSLSAMPVLRGRHPPGEEWLVCVVGGWRGPPPGFASEGNAFSAKTHGGRLVVRCGRRRIWQIATTGLMFGKK